MEYVSNSTEETAKIAGDFVKSLKPKEGQALVVGLHGELGVGKTTFMKYVAEAFGIKETIQSPTFVIMKIYSTSPPTFFKRSIHIDAYRLENGRELLKLGWTQILQDSQNIIFIEWPEKVAEVVKPDIVVRFEHAKEGGESQRKISIA